MWLCLRRNFPPLGLHKGILNSSYVLILLIHTKHKYKKMKSWIDSTSSFPWRRTHPLGRQNKKRVTNSQTAAHISSQCALEVHWTSNGGLYGVRTSYGRPLNVQRTSDVHWAGWWNRAIQDFSQSNKHEDSQKESLWFHAFPLPIRHIPTLISRIPILILFIPSLITMFPP